MIICISRSKSSEWKSNTIWLAWSSLPIYISLWIFNFSDGESKNRHGVSSLKLTPCGHLFMYVNGFFFRTMMFSFFRCADDAAKTVFMSHRLHFWWLFSLSHTLRSASVRHIMAAVIFKTNRQRCKNQRYQNECIFLEIAIWC